MDSYNPQTCHNYLMENAPRKLAYKNDKDFAKWQQEAAAKLTELIGLDNFEKCDPNLKIEYKKETDLYIERKIVFTAEKYADVPCHLLTPKKGVGPFPLVITLQGHSTGMHISLGRPKYENDLKSIKGGRDYAIQAVKEGYAALAIEQRCFGERKDNQPEHVHGCHQGTMGALLLGRTMIAERVWDVQRAIDVIEDFADIDNERIACMGNSGGGIISYYAACLDSRIKIVMPSCSISTYKDSIGKIYHCTDNYIPGIYNYFEMGELAGLIASRPLIVVAGKEDSIFPIDGVKENFELIQKVYDLAGAGDKCRLVIGQEGHKFYPEMAWPVFKELSNW